MKKIYIYIYMYTRTHRHIYIFTITIHNPSNQGHVYHSWDLPDCMRAFRCRGLTSNSKHCSSLGDGSKNHGFPGFKRYIANKSNQYNAHNFGLVWWRFDASWKVKWTVFVLLMPRLWNSYQDTYAWKHILVLVTKGVDTHTHTLTASTPEMP